MQFLICPFGTAGDVYPFIAIGQGLKRRGHDVCIIGHTLFGDTIKELSTWYCFTEKYQEDRKRRSSPVLPFIDQMATTPITNPLRGVGRNDPCPCGSGKKYKKCCLH